MTGMSPLAIKLIDDSFLDENGKIKSDLKFNINNPTFKIQNSKLLVNSGKFKTMLFLPEGEDRKGEGGLRTKGFFKFSYKYVNNTWMIADYYGNALTKVPSDIVVKINEYIRTTENSAIKELPLITVITVVYNGEKYLEQTIQSVISQTYPNVEYIIIDGGSTDGTIDIIKKYEDYVDYWVSEKDGGIYDAMNKGIDLSTGTWINFMNAGDGFYADDVLDKIFLQNKLQNLDVVYGNHNVIYPNRKRVVKAGNIKDIWKGSQFCHQSAFVSSKVHKSNKFNLNNRIGADFELFYTLYKKNMGFKDIDIIVANYSAGGLSDIKRVDSIVGRWNVVEKDTKVNLYYVWTVLKEILKSWVKRVVEK